MVLKDEEFRMNGHYRENLDVDEFCNEVPLKRLKECYNE